MGKFTSEPVNFILIEDSNWCNMCCSYCDHWQSNIKSHQLLSKEALESIFNFTIRQGTRCEILHLLTEPLLNYENIKQALPEKLPNFITHNLYTNGLLLDDEKINFLISRNVNITISFDGLHQKYRMRGTFQTLDNLIRAYPYCFGISAVMQHTSPEECLENLKYLLSLPINGLAYKPNTEYEWTIEELKHYYTFLLSNCSEEEKYFIGLHPDIIKNTNSLTPQMCRKNALFIKSDGMVHQHIQMWKTTEIGTYKNFEKNIQDFYKINYFSEDYNCENCSLKAICSPFENPHLTMRIGKGSCNYRIAMKEVMGK